MQEWQARRLGRSGSSLGKSEASGNGQNNDESEVDDKEEEDAKAETKTGI